MKLKFIFFILFAIFYFYVFAIEFIRFSILPAVDRNIAHVVQKKTSITPKTQTECFTAGGEWRKPGPWPKETCMMPYPDGGKTCFAGLQCEARDCLFSSGPSNAVAFTTGACPKYQIYFGCISKIHFGITDKTVCLD